MKFFLLLACLCVLQMGWSQSELNNGRDQQAKPATTAEKAATPAPAAEQFTGSDQDVPGQWQKAEDQEDLTFPSDLETLREELNVSASPRQVVERVNAMNDKLEALLVANEELRRENEVIRKSLQQCCSSSNLEAEDAYLLQNSPNPVVDQSQIRYFVPENMTNARVEIADLKGIVLQSYELEEMGLNQVSIDTQSLGTGNYVYTLYVDGAIVDSRIMVVTK